MNVSKAMSSLLLALAMVIIFLLPEDGHPHYYTALLATKSVGFALGWLGIRIAPEISEDSTENDEV